MRLPRLARPLPVVAALLLAVLAGCVGAPGKTMTAREGLGDAEDAAGDWADGEKLHLLGVIAVEPFKRINYTSDDGEESGEFVTHLDGHPGDGKAPAWAYGFLAGDRCIAIVLAAGLGVLAEGYDTCDGDDPVGDWSVDSDKVADILGARDDWPDLGPDGTYFWELGQEDGKAVWTVGGAGQDGESAMAAVDANSGEVLMVQQGSGEDFGFFPGSAGPSSPSHGGSGSDEDQDSATTLVAGESITAEVDLGGVGSLVLEVSARSTLQPLRLSVEGPGGPIDQQDVGGVVGNNVQEHFEYSDLAPGHYTVTLTSQGATAFPSVIATAFW